LVPSNRSRVKAPQVVCEAKLGRKIKGAIPGSFIEKAQRGTARMTTLEQKQREKLYP